MRTHVSLCIEELLPQIWLQWCLIDREITRRICAALNSQLQPVVMQLARPIYPVAKGAEVVGAVEPWRDEHGDRHGCAVRANAARHNGEKYRLLNGHVFSGERQRVFLPWIGIWKEVDEMRVAATAEGALDSQLDGRAEKEDLNLHGERRAAIGFVASTIVCKT